MRTILVVFLILAFTGFNCCEQPSSKPSGTTTSLGKVLSVTNSFEGNSILVTCEKGAVKLFWCRYVPIGALAEIQYSGDSRYSELYTSQTQRQTC